jgi:hypothetical protein
VSDRIDACLDGELAAAELSAAEKTQVDLVRAAAETLRAALPSAPADLDVAVLQRIRDLGIEPQNTRVEPAGDAVTARLRAFVQGLWRPRQVSFGFRPAYAAALAVLVLVLVGREAQRLLDAPPRTVAAAPTTFVQFRLEAADAQSVVLAGSFSEWQPAHELVEAEPGVWTVIVPLPPGVHDYAFLVDREHWVTDPAAATVDDGFGGVNSRLALLPTS